MILLSSCPAVSFLPCEVSKSLSETNFENRGGFVFAFVTLDGSFFASSCSDTNIDGSRAGCCMLRFMRYKSKGSVTYPVYFEFLLESTYGSSVPFVTRRKKKEERKKEKE